LSKQELIRSVDLKLVRANAQVGTLADQISAWTAENPVASRSELREGRMGFRLILDDFAKSPPLDDWGLLVGECIHNLRSSLDNLAFALARLQQDEPANAEIVHFPIFQDRAKFNEVSNNKKRRVRQSLDQMPAEAASLIERLQPFQRDKAEVPGTPNSDPLVLLQRLNNYDKHRVPSVVLVAPTEMMHSFSVEFYSEEDAKANDPPDATVWFGPLQPGVVLVEQRTNRPVAKVHVNFQGKAVVALQIGDKRPPVVKVLNELGRYTALVVDQFREFFK